MEAIKKGNKVKVHYTGKLEDGEVFDSSVSREPLEFEVGAGNMIPGFENGVIDMKKDESKTINIPCAEAYGETRKELVQDVPRTHLPEDLKPEVGMDLMSQTPDGQQMSVKVVNVTEENITVDANHALAGKDLIFDITIVEVS